MDAEQILAWQRTPSGIRWSAISKALARDDYPWAFRLLCEENTPAGALVVLGALMEAR